MKLKMLIESNICGGYMLTLLISAHCEDDKASQSFGCKVIKSWSIIVRAERELIKQLIRLILTQSVHLLPLMIMQEYILILRTPNELLQWSWLSLALLYKWIDSVNTRDHLYFLPKCTCVDTTHFSSTLASHQMRLEVDYGTDFGV